MFRNKIYFKFKLKMPSEIGKTTSDNIDVDWIPTVVR